jgi:hypothetical protein
MLYQLSYRGTPGLFASIAPDWQAGVRARIQPRVRQLGHGGPPTITAAITRRSSPAVDDRWLRGRLTLAQVPTK